MQIFADGCAVPLVLEEDADASSPGAGSAEILGLTPSRSTTDLPPWGVEGVAPPMRNERSDELRHGWLEAVQTAVGLTRPEPNPPSRR